MLSGCVLKEVSNELLLLLELFANDLLVENSVDDSILNGLGELTVGHKLDLGLRLMLRQIES